VAVEFFKPWKHGENARRVGRAAISAAALGNPFPPIASCRPVKKVRSCTLRKGDIGALPAFRKQDVWIAGVKSFPTASLFWCN